MLSSRAAHKNLCSGSACLKTNNIYLWKTIVDENRLDWKVTADPVGHIPSPVSPESVSIVLDPTPLYSEPG